MSFKDDIIILSSSRRLLSTQTPSNFDLKLTESVEGKYVLDDLFICNSAYNITSLNNVIYFNENSVNKSATLTPGYYTASQIVTALASALTTASSGYQTFTCSVNASTFKITISGEHNFSLLFSNTTNSIAKVLGFANSDTSAAAAQTGIYPVNLTVNLYYIIDFENFRPIRDNNGCIGTFIIPMSINTQGYLVYQREQKEQYVVFDRRTTSLKIRVLDPEGRVLDLNNVDWFLKLRRIYEPFYDARS